MAALNLLGCVAFYWMTMPLTVEREGLPVRAARAGDPEAWDTLFRRYQLPLYIYVREQVRDEQTALDMVQEAFVNAVRHVGSLRDDGRFGSWLFGIAHQKCVQHWRRQRRWNDPLEGHADVLVEAGDDPAEVLVRKENEEQFRTALNTLSEPHRAVLLLHFLESFSLAEIAQIMDTGLGTVKSRMHYAKAALRRALETER
jgi:RNA polymerase sigma-70 factor, ECF subfamily